MTLLFLAIIIMSLVATIINPVFGVDFEVSVWISLAMMAGAIIAFICWLFLSHKAKVIERAQNIANLREQRIAEELATKYYYDNDDDDDVDDDDDDDDEMRRNRQLEEDAVAGGAVAYWIATHGW